jgi:site-specific DNA-methyltransferase (adenine-specific)
LAPLARPRIRPRPGRRSPDLGKTQREVVRRRPVPQVSRDRDPTHTSAIASAGYTYGTIRLARSVIHVRSLHGTAIHPTQKPVELLDLLIRYGSRPALTVLDAFAGSGSTGIAARAAGRGAILVEAGEEHCQQAARWLAATRGQS